MKNQINYEKSEKNKAVENIQEQANQDETNLEQEHKTQMTKLEKDLKKYTDAYNKLKTDNTNSETALRKEYKRSFTNYTSSVQNYDGDLKNQERDNKEADKQFNDVIHELDTVKTTYNDLLEEKRKREALNQFMQMKKDEHEEKMNKVIRASEYIQAHYCGMLERKAFEKIAKKIKKAKKKKKKNP